jgi:hypothetical protein
MNSLSPRTARAETMAPRPPRALEEDTETADAGRAEAGRAEAGRVA